MIIHSLAFLTLFFIFRTLLNRLASEHANQCNEIELENEVLEKLMEELDKAELVLNETRRAVN